MYRKATMDDMERVYDLICDMEHTRLPMEKFSEIYQRQLNDTRYYCLLCEDNGNVIGVLNLRFEEQLHHAEAIAEVMEFAIDEAYRNKGIGKDMLAHACQIAEEYGCIQIEVACNQLRTDTHRFYLREKMNNFHFKFSKPLQGIELTENAIGR